MKRCVASSGWKRMYAMQVFFLGRCSCLAYGAINFIVPTLSVQIVVGQGPLGKFTQT